MVAMYEWIAWFTDKTYHGYTEIPLVSSCWMLKCPLFYGYIDTWIASGQVTGFLLLSDSLEACLDYSAG